MPYTTLHLPTDVLLHAEGGSSCKNWRASIVDEGGGLYSLALQFGPATSSAGGAMPAWKPGKSDRKVCEKETYAKVADEFIRRVSGQMKPPTAAGSPAYEIIAKDMHPDMEIELMAKSPRFAAAVRGTAAPAATAAAGASATPANELLAKLQLNLAPSREHKKPMLLDGLPGAGKTYTLREFAKVGGFHSYSEVAGNSSMEAIDFLGGMVPIGDGKMIWMDGPVTKAFRDAAAGKKVLLGIDELLRIPRRERGIFMNALVPHDGKYRLRSGRPIVPKAGASSTPAPDELIGVASMEMILAPVANISIVATTNSGANYPDIESDDPAARERWHIVHVKPSPKFTESLISARVAALKLPADTVTRLVKIDNAVKKIAEDNNCDKSLSPRLLLDMVNNLAEMPNPGDKNTVLAAATEMIPALTGRTPEGDVNPDQVEILTQGFKTALGIS